MDPVMTILRELQKALGLTPDGVWGPISQATLNAYLAPHPVPSTGELPWRNWFTSRLGWTEFDHDKELSLGWKLCDLDYTTVIGASHAWCGMSAATALHSCGYAYPKGAAWAPNWDGYGTKIDWKVKGIPKGAIVRIKHVTGAHVTTANRDHAPGETVLEALGGNQHDSICVSTFNVSGNANGHDQIAWVGWPVKA